VRVLITTPVFPPELGGPATFVPQFAAHLQRRGYQVAVLTYTDQPSGVGEYPFEVSLVRRRFLPLRIVSFFVAALRLARRADVVLVCEHPALPSVLAAKLSGRAVVLRFMVNSAWELSYRFGLTRDDPNRFLAADGNALVRSIKRLEAATLRRADLVVAVSQHLGDTAARLGVPTQRIFVSYNLPARAATSDRAEVRARFGIDADAFVLLVVARLVNWKGVDTVIASLAALPDRVRLVVAGEGPMDATLREMTARLGVGDRVRFTGRVDNDTAGALMRAADLLILNSLYEGLSHVLLEAMANGLPVVVSDVPGNRELVDHGDNGLLFAVNDRAGLEQCIVSLADSPERLRHMQQRGVERARAIAATHTFDRLAEKLAEIGGGRPASAHPTGGASGSPRA